MNWLAGLATIVAVMILGVVGRPSVTRRVGPPVPLAPANRLIAANRLTKTNRLNTAVRLAKANRLTDAVRWVPAIRLTPSNRLTSPVGISPTSPTGVEHPKRLARVGIALVIVVVGLAVIGLIATCLLVAIRSMWKRLSAVLETTRRRRQIERDMPDALDMFVLIVQSGLTPRQAVDHLAERAPDSVRVGFASVVARLDRGDPLADALAVLRHEFGTSARTLADLVGSADRYGHALAPILRQLATESRAARRRLDEAAARSLPVKLSFPLVLCTLPSFVLLAIAPAVMAALSSLGGNAL